MQYFIRQHRTARTMQLIKTILLACIAVEINAQQVSFDAEIRVHGEQITGYAPVEITGSFPYFEVRGTNWSNKSETQSYQLCMSEKQLSDKCTLDTARGDGKGYSIWVTTMNSPGGSPSESYGYDSSSGCLNSKVTVTAQRRQRGWYASGQSLYLTCPIKEKWSDTEKFEGLVLKALMATGLWSLTQSL